MCSRVLINGTTSLLDCTATLGRQPVSRIVGEYEKIHP